MTSESPSLTLGMQESPRIKKPRMQNTHGFSISFIHPYRHPLNSCMGTGGRTSSDSDRTHRSWRSDIPTTTGTQMSRPHPATEKCSTDKYIYAYKYIIVLQLSCLSYECTQSNASYPQPTLILQIGKQPIKYPGQSNPGLSQQLLHD